MFIRPTPRPLAGAVTTALAVSLTSLSFAETDDSEDVPPLQLETVTVEASKVPTTQAEISASVTVIDRERLEQELVQNISDMVRYEPGIDVVDQGSRFGRAGFTIRGLDGNRVLVEIDGVPVADAFSIGDFSNASRDFVDVDSLKQVEIIRGPSSALFGSDALGGVVSFVTKDPQDYLEAGDFNLRATLSRFGVDDSLAGSATTAGRSGDFSALLTVTARSGHERDVPLADPLSYDSLNLLGKLAWGTVGAGGVKLTVERFEEESDTDVVSLIRTQDFSDSFGFPFIINTDEVAAADERTRSRLSLDQTWNDGLGFTRFLRWRAFTQDSQTLQDTFESRSSLIMDRTTAVERFRRFDFEQELRGIEVNAASKLDFGPLDGQLAYGFEYEQASTTQLRDGLETSLTTGMTSNQVGPDVYPVRDFPNSDTDSLGIYLQGTFNLGPVTLIPALRWDQFELTPEPDDIFLDDNPGIVPVPLDESELTPKLGVLWDLAEAWQLFAQYSEGFRAPPVNDVNVGFTNFQFGYTAIPNPDLTSETSTGYEAGLRYFGVNSQWELSAYRSDYENFIEPFQVVGFDPLNNLIIFQSVNLTEVEIHGLELRGQWAPEAFPDGLFLRFAASWSEGDNRETNQPLNTVAPLNGVIGLEFTDPNERWGASLLTSAADRQDRLDESNGPVLSPDGYLTVDLTGWWKPTANTRLRAGVFNLLDEQFTPYLNVAGLPADTPNPERFQSPGTNFSLAFDWTFR